MSFSTGVEHSVALGAEEQKSIWCYSGIDLFVSLEIDSTESTQADSLSSWASSDAPRPIQVLPRASVTPPLNAVEEASNSGCTVDNLERKHREISREGSESGCRTHGETSCSKVSPRDLHKDVLMPREILLEESRRVAHNETSREQIRREVKQSRRVENRRSQNVGGRGFVTSASSPLVAQRHEAQRVEEWSGHPDDRSGEDGHVNPFDPEALRSQFKHGFPACGNLVTGYRCLAGTKNPDDLNCASHGDFQDQYGDRSRADEKPFFWNENRRWTPQVEDNYWVSMDVKRDPDNKVSERSKTTIVHREDLVEVCSNLPSSSFPSENEVVGQIQHDANFSMENMLRSKFPEIESFDVAEISAACQLVKMSTYGCRNEINELDLSIDRVYNLGFRGASNERMLSNIAENSYTTSADMEVHETTRPLQPGSNKLELSLWSHDDRYIPRLARRAKARLRGSKFSTRIDFGNPEIDEDSDCEHRPPRKRQYKSTPKFLPA